MNKEHPAPRLEMIPVDAVDVLNPRERNNKVFGSIVANIKDIGLKKPISVTPRKDSEGRIRYLLVCGEGRLKAYRLLGQTEIPALIVKASDEDAFVMSLAENIARRKYHPLELLRGIERMHEQGYDKREMAAKTGLSTEYIQDILYLLRNGEERLLAAVGAGRIPLNCAMTIAGAGNDDKAIQAALQDAYETKKLRGNSLIQARKIIEGRRTFGRALGRGLTGNKPTVTSISLVRTYQHEIERQRLIVRKAEYTQQRLLFVVEALRQLFADENFVTLLRAEGMDSLPKQLAERM